jgi:hypothetical protein
MPPATFPVADNKGFALVAQVAKRGPRNTLCTAPRAGIAWRRHLACPDEGVAGGLSALHYEKPPAGGRRHGSPSRYLGSILRK